MKERLYEEEPTPGLPEIHSIYVMLSDLTREQVFYLDPYCYSFTAPRVKPDTMCR